MAIFFLSPPVRQLYARLRVAREEVWKKKQVSESGGRNRKRDSDETIEQDRNR